MHVWLDFALAKLIALAPKVGFKLGSIHRHCLSQDVEQPHNEGQPTREVEQQLAQALSPRYAAELVDERK